MCIFNTYIKVNTPYDAQFTAISLSMYLFFYNFNRLNYIEPSIDLYWCPLSDMNIFCHWFEFTKISSNKIK